MRNNFQTTHSKDRVEKMFNHSTNILAYRIGMSVAIIALIIFASIIFKIILEKIMKHVFYHYIFLLFYSYL